MHNSAVFRYDLPIRKKLIPKKDIRHLENKIYNKMESFKKQLHVSNAADKLLILPFLYTNSSSEGLSVETSRSVFA